MKASKYFKQARMLLCYGASIKRCTEGMSYRRLKKAFALHGYHLHRDGNLVRGKLVKHRGTPLDVLQAANVVHSIDSSCAGALNFMMFNTFKEVKHLGAGLYECIDGRGRIYHVCH